MARRRCGRCAARRARCFLLAWIVPAWLVFEFAVTKLPHYVLPLYPAIAILLAGDDRLHVLTSGALAGARARSWWFVLPVLLAISPSRA